MLALMLNKAVLKSFVEDAASKHLCHEISDLFLGKLHFGDNSNYFHFPSDNISSLPTLTPVQLTKLKHLTIVALAAKCRVSLLLGVVASSRI